MKLNALFQDGAILQRRISIPVWGMTEGSCPIKATLAGVEAWGRSAIDGSFLLRFPAMEAGGPYVLVVKNTRTGEVVEVKDVLIGEVWFASGQSNMEYRLGSVPQQSSQSGIDEPLNVRQSREFHGLDLEPQRFRYIYVNPTQGGAMEPDFQGIWKKIDKQSASGVSAVAAWFGYFVKQKLDVPVGLIITALSGSKIEAWSSRAALLRNPDTRPIVDELDALHSRPSSLGINTQRGEFFWIGEDDIPANSGIEKGYAQLDFDDSEAKLFNVPGSWKLQNLSGNGVIWARRKIRIPSHWEGKELILHLGGIDKTDITYFNGVEVGRTGNGKESDFWNRRREYPIPGNLVRDGEAVVAVRAYSFYCDGSLNGSPDAFFLEIKDEPAEKIPLAGEWRLLVETDLGDVRSSTPDAPYGVDNLNTPSLLFNTRLRPIIPYAIRGIIWYQGENNAKTIETARLYGNRLAYMIDDLRNRWEQANLPFLMVQLPNYGQYAAYDAASSWAILREQQLNVCRRLPQVYAACTIDVGDGNNLHPHDKKSVGYRLAQSAFCNVYRMQTLSGEGPVYERCENCGGGRIRLFFVSANGLCLRGEHPECAFVVAGADGDFKPADFISVEGTTLLLASAQVTRPQAVRYAWAGNPSSVLYNDAGLPASPFRTDCLPI